MGTDPVGRGPATTHIAGNRHERQEALTWTMKVLVTGASGYVGGRLCRALLRRGFAVRAFVRRTSDCSSLPSAADDDGRHLLEVFYGDVTDYPSLLSALSGCDAVFHSAALVEPWLPDPSIFFRVVYLPSYHSSAAYLLFLLPLFTILEIFLGWE